VLVVSAGSADEPASMAGLAHLTEHVAFGGRHGGVSLRDMQRERRLRAAWAESGGGAP
jgi:predicted Zn-dependent peptidase